MTYHQHYGRENVVRNNILVNGQNFQLSVHRPELQLSCTFENNIVYFKTGRLFWATSLDNHQLSFTRNLYWDATGRPLDFMAMSFEQWQALGQDRDSVVADPLFEDPDHLDFRLKPDSPALQLGFKPFDYSRAGLYGDPAWVALVKSFAYPPVELPPEPPPPPPLKLDEDFENYPLGAVPAEGERRVGLLTLLRKCGTLHPSSTFVAEGARVGVMEEEAGRLEERSDLATGEPSLENPPPATAAGEEGKAAEETLAEAAEAIWEAIRSRARLFAPALLDHAEIRLAAARDQYEAGAYSEARVMAQQALASAVQALSHAEHQQQLRRARRRRRQRIWGYGISGVLAGALLWRGVGYVGQSRSHLAAVASQQSQPPAPTRREGPEGSSSRPPAAPKAPAERFVAVEAERLNVREGPGTHFPRHARPLARGQKMRVVQEKGDWLQVDLGAGKRGWIAGKYTREASVP